MRTQLNQSQILDAALEITSIVADRLTPVDYKDRVFDLFVEATKKIKKEYNCE